MRILHTADWHLGRIFYGHHLTEDQSYVLENQLFSVLRHEKVDAIVIAGDIFDRAVPPVDAVALWDRIVTRIAMEFEIPVFVIAGNHDGAERLAAGRAFYEERNVYIWGLPDQAMKPYIWQSPEGPVAICPMPFAEPRMVYEALVAAGAIGGEGESRTNASTNTSVKVDIDCTDTSGLITLAEKVGDSAGKTLTKAAAQSAAKSTGKTERKSKRGRPKKKAPVLSDDLFAGFDVGGSLESVKEETTSEEVQERVAQESLVKYDYNEVYRLWAQHLLKQVPEGMPTLAISHAFVAGSAVGGSERQLSVGGSDFVQPAAYRNFTYTALGHIHNSQRAGEDYIRYSGSPLKYSFDESHHEKSFTLVDLDDKGGVDIHQVPIQAQRDVVILQGTLDELMAHKEWQVKHKDDYILVQLMDQAPVIDGMATLRKAYPNVLALELTGRMQERADDVSLGAYKKLNERDLFSQFAQAVWKEPLSEKELAYMDEIWNLVNKEDA